MRLGEPLEKGCEMLPTYPPSSRIPPQTLRPLGGAWTRSTGTPPPPLRWPRQGSSWACGKDRWPSPAGAPQVPPRAPGASADRGQRAWAGRWVQTGLTRPLTATHPLAFVLFSQHTFGDIAEREGSPGFCFPSASETSG